MYSFRLNDAFVEQYRDRPVKWGFTDASDFNSLGELTYLRTYSRKKEDGTKEKWWETCQRVVEGEYSIQKDYIQSNTLEWNYGKSQRSAQDAMERLFDLKWSPPGRGLFVMGSPIVNGPNGTSAPLQNCAGVSTKGMTKEDPSAPFTFLMEASMLGVGVGFDQLGAKKNLKIHKPGNVEVFVVPDTREGWVETLKLTLESYLKPCQPTWEFDYSLVRPAGSPIKTFGGTASGPAPLEEMHKSLNKVLGDRIDCLLSTTDIADIGNIIGKCVVSGNVRRSAELLVGSIDDDAFLGLKDYNSESGQRRADWSWMSNNSVDVKVGTDLSKIIPGIEQNGEPGVLWLDVSRQYGRLADPINNKDHRAVIYNPCLVGNAKLLTDQGWITFGNAFKSGEQNNLIVDSRVTYSPTEDGVEHPTNWKIDYAPGAQGVAQAASEVFLTQKDAPVVKVSFAEGHEVTLTPDHLIATKNRGMVPAGELVLGDKALLTAGPLPVDSIVGRDPQTIAEIEAALMGLIAGDGTFKIGKQLNNSVVIDLWGDDKDSLARICSWIDILWDAYGSTMVCDSNRGYTKYCISNQPTRDKISISSMFLGVMLNSKYGFTRGDKHIVPEFVMENARNSIGHFYLAGLAFADGTINKREEAKKQNSSNARISQSNKPLLQDVQRMLLANGMSSSIFLRKKAGWYMLPANDGTGENKLFYCQDNYDVILTHHKFEFSRLIGFLGSHKDAKAQIHFTKTSRKRAPFIARVLAVEDAGREDVYCLREPNRRILCADGITMRRCAEQTLESYECCTLVETYLNRHETLEDFKKTLKVAYLYGKTVTLKPTHWPRTNAIMQRNRRIGLSISGIANFADNRGIPELKRWMDEGYKEIQRLDKTYSEWLCVRESIKTTTVKPSGTVSILAGESPGVHWQPGANVYMRTIRFGKDDPMVQLFRWANYKVEPDVVNSDSTVVVYFPIKSAAKRSEKDVKVFEKAALAVLAQRWWSDNSVSVTLSFDPETEAKDVGTILAMYEGQLKTVSFLPMLDSGSYAQMPYSPLTEEEYNEYTMKLLPIDWSPIYDGLGLEAIGEAFCTTDACEVKTFKLNNNESEVSK